MFSGRFAFANLIDQTLCGKLRPSSRKVQVKTIGKMLKDVGS